MITFWEPSTNAHKRTAVKRILLHEFLEKAVLHYITLYRTPTILLRNECQSAKVGKMIFTEEYVKHYWRDCVDVCLKTPSHIPRTKYRLGQGSWLVLSYIDAPC